jgi:putative glycosyltransferase (TIGR04348 family)
VRGARPYGNISRVKVGIVTPQGPAFRTGNRTTADRWARFLRELGHDVGVEQAWSGGDEDAGIFLHARKSHPSIKRYAGTGRPLVVVLTGTDLYRDFSEPETRESLELATQIIVLQEAAFEDLEERHRRKARVIHQSAEPVKREPPSERSFDVLVVGNLRAEKDPFRAALAAKLLPRSSRVRVIHAGASPNEEWTKGARAHAASNPRYRWLGEASHPKVRELLARTRLFVQSSTMEGGANTVSEALAAGAPILASRIPGNTGMLGRGYPGYFPARDEEALARLLRRAETDAPFYALLAERCADMAPLSLPEREKEALKDLLARLY